jgi:hypothetical protein
MGARAQGLAYATSCLSDEWAVLNNPAGLAEVERTSTAISCQSYPKLSSFNRIALVGCFPASFGSIGMAVFRFGDDLYNEGIISIGYANRFGSTSLGAKINYIQYRAEEFGSTGIVTVSFGGITNLTSNLMVGAHITNINQPEIATGEHVPTRIALGLGYEASTKVLIVTEVEKDLDYDAVWRNGIEYRFNNKFNFRSGFSINEESAFLGFGFDQRKLKLDYAVEYNLNVGMNHQATLAYKFITK